MNGNDVKTKRKGLPERKSLTLQKIAISWQHCKILMQTKGLKSYEIEGCYKWDLSHLNLAPFLFVLITCEPMRNIETSISANHNLLLFEKRRQIQMGKVPLIASLNFIGFYSFRWWDFTKLADLWSAIEFSTLSRKFFYFWWLLLDSTTTVMHQTASKYGRASKVCIGLLAWTMLNGERFSLNRAQIKSSYYLKNIV